MNCRSSAEHGYSSPILRFIVLAAFTTYGALWGPYLATLPEIRHTAAANDGQLGIAMLVGALAAVPTMIGVGRLFDRFGRSVAIAAVVLFALVAPLPTLAGSVPELIIAVALFGIGSGGCNVVLVAMVAAVEAATGGLLMNRAHALFSVGVLVCSVTTGVAISFGLPGRVVAVALASGVVAGALVARRAMPSRISRPDRPPRRRFRLGRGAGALCLLAGLAMVVESGVQQWSALFLTNVVRAPVGLSAAAPGVFAAAMALGRLGGHWLSQHACDRAVLLASGVLSGMGVLLLTLAEAAAHGLLGTAFVGAAISVATPTVYGIVGRAAAPGERGIAIGSTASLASTGCLLGPAMVGQMAAYTDLRSAIAMLSLVSLAVGVLALRVPAGVG